jgi:hypothetical protein
MLRASSARILRAEDTARLDALLVELGLRAGRQGSRGLVIARSTTVSAAPAYAEAFCPTNASVGILPLSFRVSTGSGHEEWGCR